MTNKQSLIFLCSFVAITFSFIGWLNVSFLSPNKYIWVISIPIIIFIAAVEAYVTTEAIFRSRDDDKQVIDINDMDVQSRIRTILSSVQFDCMQCNFTTKFHWDKIVNKVDNLTEWQKMRLDRMFSEMVELEEILIKTGVIK